MNLAQRSTSSAVWNISSTTVTVAIQFVSAVLLARWLPVEVFGVYAFANSFVILMSMLPEFGMSGAFLHRAPETENEAEAATIHFTLRVIFALPWAVLLIAGTLLLTHGELQTAFLVITATTFAGQLTNTPIQVLTRRVEQQRLAVIQVMSIVISTPVALILARLGMGLWALLVAQPIGVVLNVLMLYVWRPVWRPHFGWNSSAVRYFLWFGFRNFFSTTFSQALDRVDDIWVGAFLGETPMGLYSRAFSFATYPRKIIADPLNTVIWGAYAELKGDRLRLSRVFMTTCGLLLRSGFLVAGLLSAIAPEFIRVVLGVKWLPMLTAFQLMLVFTLFDPIKIALSGLISLAGGKPEWVARTRLMQLAVFVVGLFALGPIFGIVGAALALDTMLVVGVASLLWQARAFVSFSLTELMLVPIAAVLVGLTLANGTGLLVGGIGPGWLTGLLKGIVFVSTYLLLLFVLERKQLAETYGLSLTGLRKLALQLNRSGIRAIH